MFAGWKVAGIVGLIALAGIGIQEIRVRGLATDLVAAEANVKTLQEDVAEAVETNSSLLRELDQATAREAKKTADLAAVSGQNRALQSKIDRDRREARNAPIPAGQESCPAVRGDLRDFALRLLERPPAALGGDQGGHTGGAAGPKPAR